MGLIHREGCIAFNKITSQGCSVNAFKSLNLPSVGHRMLVLSRSYCRCNFAQS